MPAARPTRGGEAQGQFAGQRVWGSTRSSQQSGALTADSAARIDNPDKLQQWQRGAA